MESEKTAIMSLRSFDTRSFDNSDDFRHSMGSSGGGVAITDGDMAERQKSFIARTLRTVGSKFFEGELSSTSRVAKVWTGYRYGEQYKYSRAKSVHEELSNLKLSSTCRKTTHRTVPSRERLPASQLSRKASRRLGLRTVLFD
mmetsp:Transcript_42238/g.164971  ORF Transcript_42238/g.164971 Transcript_42238/m.164971 type:complete len:143 (+) Transcript_42238:57-485(+)